MILDDIVADKERRLLEHKKILNEDYMKKTALNSKRKSYSFYEALSKEGLSIIGEFKKASPSMGVISNRLDIADRIKKYNLSVDAISCLTEEDHFNGNIEYFKKIREISSLPMIRKDFIIDEYQIYEAKVIGADAVLLIAAILEDDEMKKLYELAYSLGMDVLLEVHDEKEMERALRLNARIIGINNRNLKDFSIQLDTTKRLSEYMKNNIKHTRPVLVSESGVTKTEDINFLKMCNIDALLIGRAFMESDMPELLAAEWKKEYDLG